MQEKRETQEKQFDMGSTGHDRIDLQCDYLQAAAQLEAMLLMPQSPGARACQSLPQRRMGAVPYPCLTAATIDVWASVGVRGHQLLDFGTARD